MVAVRKVHAEFVLSAADPLRFPAPDLPEIAFAGRSNVGKSSLINALVGAKIAHVSSTPGRTRTINFFDVTQEPANRSKKILRIADLPGYGYAKVSKSLSAEWPKFIEPYLRDREAMRLCVCLIDANVPPQDSDAQLLRWLQHHDRPYLAVATKTDRLGGNQLRNSVRALTKAHGLAEVLPVSVRNDRSLGELWKKMLEACSVQS